MYRRAHATARLVSGVVLAGGLFTALGCGAPADKLHPVTGRVLANGKPAAGAIVTFHPETSAGPDSIISTGVANDDGTFTLTTGSGQGAKEGKYVVTVYWGGPPKKQADKVSTTSIGGIDSPDVFGGKYMTRDKSPLRADVKPGDNKLEAFDLK